MLQYLLYSIIWIQIYTNIGIINGYKTQESKKKKYHTPEQLQKSNLKIGFIFLVIFCVLTPLSAIFQLYHGDQF